MHIVHTHVCMGAHSRVYNRQFVCQVHGHWGLHAAVGGSVTSIPPTRCAVMLLTTLLHNWGLKLHVCFTKYSR